MFGFSKTNQQAKMNASWIIDESNFLEDPLEQYLNGHTQLMIDDIKEFIPPVCRYSAFIAGGFAAHVAGITTTYNDIDIFCLDTATYVAIKDCLPTDSNPTEVGKIGYARLTKFTIHNQDYHLIDLLANLKAPAVSSIADLLESFDINWCMAGIDLAHKQLHIHADALLTKPKISIDHLYTDNVVGRIQKYADRLVRTSDESMIKSTIQEFEQRVANKASSFPGTTVNRAIRSLGIGPP